MRKNYIPPRITSVDFTIESGYAGTTPPTGLIDLFILPDEGGDSPWRNEHFDRPTDNSDYNFFGD